MSSKKFYTYVLLDPRKPGKYTYYNFITFLHEPFYVGKGIFERCDDHFKETKETTHNPYKFYTIQKIKNLNLHPSVLKIKQNLSEDKANNLEKLYIKFIGRADKDLGPLTNLTDGGEGGGKMRSIQVVFTDKTFSSLTELDNYMHSNFGISMWRTASYYIKQYPTHFIKVKFYRKFTSTLSVIAFVMLIKEYKSNLKNSEAAKIKRKNYCENSKVRMSGKNNPMYGKKRSKEWRIAHSNLMKGNNNNAIKVMVNGNTYPSIKEASKKEGLYKGTIRKRINSNIDGYKVLQ